MHKEALSADRRPLYKRVPTSLNSPWSWIPNPMGIIPRHAQVSDQQPASYVCQHKTQLRGRQLTMESYQSATPQTAPVLRRRTDVMTDTRLGWRISHQPGPAADQSVSAGRLMQQDPRLGDQPSAWPAC